ncbi:MAG TPA: hypothetical protein VM935_19000 [Chitinophagaceae bacterium]|nr:hypothetical protein [Chitinophagaceae bacterium]
MRRIIILVVVLVLLAGGWYAYKLYTGKVPSVTEMKTDASLTAAALITAFEKDSASANKNYLGKIIEVSGTIKTIDMATGSLSLGDSGNTSSVRCSMDSAFVKTISTLNPGGAVIIKGACTGYLPDETGLGLGSDVVMNRCIIEMKKQ